MVTVLLSELHQCHYAWNPHHSFWYAELKIYLLLWLKWWGTVHIKYAGFLSKWLQLLYEGRKKKCKLLLLFLPLLCLWCVFISTEINGRDKHGHQPWLRFSAHGRHSYRGLPSKGSPILVFVNGGSLNEIPPKHEILHVQQLNGIASVVYIWLYDIFRLYALAEIYIVLDGLFFQLKYAANNVLTYECYFLYW